tara:strand:- start:4425 stop:4880 length:456 start_codon:yes stop_codon:yes gene_type:complete
MLQLKYTLSSLNNLLLVPSGYRILSVSSRDLPNKTQQAYVKIGIPRDAADWAGNYQSYSRNQYGGQPRGDFQVLRIALVPETDTMDYVSYLDCSDLEIVQAIGVVEIREKSYSAYAIIEQTPEANNAILAGNNTVSTSSVVNEANLTRNIL